MWRKIITAMRDTVGSGTTVAGILDSENRCFHSLADSLEDAILVHDRNGIVQFWNNGGESLFGVSEADMLGKPVTSLFSEQWGAIHGQALLRLDQDTLPPPGTSWKLEGVCRHGSGTTFSGEVTCSVWFRNEEPFFTMVIRDLAERRLLEARELRSLTSRIAISALLEIGLEPLSLQRKLEICLEILLAIPWMAVQSKGSIFMVAVDGTLEMVAQQGLHEHLLQACRRIPLGYCLCGRAAQQGEIVFADGLDDRHDVTYNGIKQHGHYCVPILLRDRLMGVLNLYVDAGHCRDPEEDAFLTTISNTLAGLMEHGLAGEKIQHLAHHDTLTGLPNRSLFLEHLEQELRNSGRANRKMAIIFIDLDHFKEVNDSLGHEAGDILLRCVTDRFRECLRKSDLLARLGGDEFIALLPDIGASHHAVTVGEKLLQVLRAPVVIHETPCHVGASIGVSVFPEHGQTVEELMAKADQAMYQVKNSGRNGVQLFEQRPF